MSRSQRSAFSPLGFALGAFLLAAGLVEPGELRWVFLGICALISLALFVRASQAEDGQKPESKL